jgi:hypothetical protein
VTLTLLWQEYRVAHPHGYGFTWFCDRFAAFRQRTSAMFRNWDTAGCRFALSHENPSTMISTG